MPLTTAARYRELELRAVRALGDRTPVIAESIMDFRGGLSLLEPYSLSPNQVRRADNLMIWRDGRVRRRRGSSQWGTNALGAPSSVTRLWTFLKADGSRFFLAAASNGSIYKDAGQSGAWTTVTTGLVGDPDVHPRARTFANRTILVDKNNAPQVYDGTTWSALSGVPADIDGATVIEAHHGRLWLGAEPGTGSRVRFSDLSDPTSWPTNNFLDISINDGEDIQALMIVQNQLFVAKRTRLYVVLGDSPTTYGWFPRTRPGVLAPDSVQIIDNVAYFLSDDGVYRFDGVRAQKVSWTLDPLFDTDAPGVNLSRLSLAQSAYDPILRQYWLLVSGPGSSTHDTVYVGHLGFMVETEDGRAILPFTKYPSLARNTVAGIPGSDGIVRIFAGGHDGIVWLQNTGTDDGASSISWTLETRDLPFGDIDRLKLPQFADLFVDDIAGGSMTVTPIYDFGAIEAAGISVDLDGGTDPHVRTISLPEQGQMIRLRLSGTTDVGLRGLVVYARRSRGRR